MESVCLMHVESKKNVQWLVCLIIVVLSVFLMNSCIGQTTLIFPQSNGNFEIGDKMKSIPLPAPPANDNCGGAIALTPSYSYTNTNGTFAQATDSPQTICGGTSMDNGDVWYKFVATDTKHIIAVTGNDPYSWDGDMYMQVFSGACVSLTSIACVNNEVAGDDYSHQEKLVYSSFVVGQTYYIRTYYSGGFSVETFRIGVLRVPPTNAADLCTAALQLDSGVVYNGENFSATRVCGAPQTNDPRRNPTDEWGGYNSSTDNTVWYKFKSNSVGGTISVNFTNLQFAQNPADGIQFAIYKFNGCQATGSWVTPVTGINDFKTDQTISFAATANSTYYLVIDGSSGHLATWNIKVNGNSTVPMPIDLLNFEAKCINGNVELSWATASETNNDYFTLEKSQNAIDFIEVERMKGVGNSNNNTNYQTVDLNKNIGVAYYRLKQTDFDGKYSYSSIITVNCNQSLDDELNVFIYPNPATDWFRIATVPGIVLDAIQIYAVTGFKVKELNWVKSDQKIDVADLTDGLYLVKVFAKGRVCCVKLQKKRD